MVRRLIGIVLIALVAVLVIGIATPSAPARRGGTLFTLGPGFSTKLLGGFEVSSTGRANAGDRDGNGWATVALVGRWTICYSIIVSNIAKPVAAHIHRAGPGTSGAVVVPLRAPGSAAGMPAGLGTSSGCVSAPEAIVGAIRARPSGFYVNVHTADVPAGALRGQL